MNAQTLNMNFNQKVECYYNALDKNALDKNEKSKEKRQCFTEG